jgi:hypothetical protein
MRPFAVERPLNVAAWDHFAHQQWYDKVSRFTRAITTVKAVSAAYTVEPEVYWVRVDASSGAITVTLPPVGVVGRPVGIMKSDSSSNAVTIDGNGSETIEGAATQSLPTQFDSMLLRDNGTSWDIEQRNSSVLTSIINNGFNVFKTIAVSGQSNVVADSGTDTLTLVGSGVTITTTPASDTITFTVDALTADDVRDLGFWCPLVNADDPAAPVVIYHDDGSPIMVWNPT